MTYEEKLALAREELINSGIARSEFNPPLLRICSKFGIKLKPAYYAGFLSNLLTLGLYFAVFWGIFMRLTVWNNPKMPEMIVVISSLVAGLLFGALMSGYFKYKSSKHNLTRWEDLGES